jgi:hypothetical protein
MFKKLSALLLCASLILAVIGCGGGNGDSSATIDISGIWEGNFTDQFNQVYSVVGITTENREARFVSELGGQYSGTVNVSGNSISGTLRAYAPVGFLFPDGSTVGNVSISGTVITKQSFTGTYVGVGDSGSFSLTYDSIYERPSSLSLISGNWILSEFGYTFTVTINNAGVFSGNDTDGCVYNGTVSIINSSYNAYRINLTVSSCGTANGNYSGLAVLSDDVNVNDTLIYGVSNQNLSATGFLERL